MRLLVPPSLRLRPMQTALRADWTIRPQDAFQHREGGGFIVHLRAGFSFSCNHAFLAQSRTMEK
jgi:hypothetical protein